jgi:hypothetical protein
MFGFTIIRKDRLQELEKNSQIAQNLIQLHYWFSGFPEVCWLLNKFANGGVNHVTIDTIREEFDRSIHLDKWGRPIPEPEQKAMK